MALLYILQHLSMGVGDASARAVCFHTPALPMISIRSTLEQASSEILRQLALRELQCESCCVPAGYAEDGKQYSLLEYLLRETEQMHGRIRRYTSPDEHAFFARDLPPLVLPPIQYPEVGSSVLHSTGNAAHLASAEKLTPLLWCQPQAVTLVNVSVFWLAVTRC